MTSNGKRIPYEVSIKGIIFDIFAERIFNQHSNHHVDAGCVEKANINTSKIRLYGQAFEDRFYRWSQWLDGNTYGLRLFFAGTYRIDLNLAGARITKTLKG